MIRAPKSSRGHISAVLLVVVHLASRLAWACPVSVAFLSRHFTFLEHRLRDRRGGVHSHGTISQLHAWPYQRYTARSHSPSSKYVWKPPWSHNSSILQAWTTTVKWVMPRSAASFSITEATWTVAIEHGFWGLWMLGWLRTVKCHLGHQVLQQPFSRDTMALFWNKKFTFLDPRD